MKWTADGPVAETKEEARTLAYQAQVGDKVVHELSEPAIRALALIAAVKVAGASMQDPEPLHYVEQYERYIRQGFGNQGDDDDQDV